MQRTDLKQTHLPGYDQTRGVAEVKTLMNKAAEVLVRKPAKKKIKTRNTTIVSVSLEPELAEEAKRVARRFGLTVSGLIRLLLREQAMTDADLTIRPKKLESETP